MFVKTTLFLFSCLLSSEIFAQNVAVCCEAGIANRIQSLGYSVRSFVAPSDVIVANLDGIDVLFITNGMAPSLTPQSKSLWKWVKQGFGMIIEQPNVAGSILLLPPKRRFSVFSREYDANNAVSVTFTGLTHPITNGLSSDDLPGNADKVLVVDVPLAWEILGVQTSNSTLAAIGSSSFGLGRYVFETGNTNPTSIKPGSDTFMRRILSWAGENSPSRAMNLQSE